MLCCPLTGGVGVSFSFSPVHVLSLSLGKTLDPQLLPVGRPAIVKCFVRLDNISIISFGSFKLILA